MDELGYATRIGSDGHGPESIYDIDVIEFFRFFFLIIINTFF